MLIDRVGKYQLEEFVDCSYGPLARILSSPSRVMEEEDGHIDYGTTRAYELTLLGDDAKARVQKSIDHWYVTALDMFGNTGSKRAERYIEWGLKKRRNEEAREQYIAEVNPLIENMGLVVPDPLQGRKYL
jgi:1,2-phenylacetyl-CoA epoxidase catalytic subunit